MKSLIAPVLFFVLALFNAFALRTGRRLAPYAVMLSGVLFTAAAHHAHYGLGKAVGLLMAVGGLTAALMQR